MKNCINIIKTEFKNKRFLVIGDLMVDKYIFGQTNRMSPEAPVPILDCQTETSAAGGGANVAINLKALGGDVAMLGIVGDDTHGEWLVNYLNQKGICTDGIAAEQARPTTVKIRYVSKGKHLLRVDKEDKSPANTESKAHILDYISKLDGKIDAVVISDYCKGLFSDSDFVKNIIEAAHKRGAIVTVDSKRTDLACLKNADIVKPNNLELAAAVGINIVDDESYERAGFQYLTLSGAKTVLVTRGECGMSIFQKGLPRKDFPACKNASAIDVTGAGDTVISTVTMSLASGIDFYSACHLANIAAAKAISRIGTVAVTAEDLTGELYEIKNC